MHHGPRLHRDGAELPDGASRHGLGQRQRVAELADGVASHVALRWPPQPPLPCALTCAKRDSRLSLYQLL